MIGAAAALLLAATPAADAPPADCDEYWIFCDNIVGAGVLSRFDLPPARSLADQGYVGIRVITQSGHGGWLPMISVLRRGEGSPVAGAREAGKPAREFPASDATWQAALKLSADMKAGPPSYRLTDPEAICLHPWTFAIEVIDADGVTTRARDTCALEQSGLDAQALANAITDDIPGCERLERDGFGSIPAYRLRACLTLAASRRGTAAEVVNAWEASPMARVAGEDVRPENWLTSGVALHWPDRVALRGRDTVARFWRIASNEDQEQSASDLGLGEITARYEAARAISDRRVRVTGELWQDNEPGDVVAEFVQEWRLGDDGRWRLASWEVGDFVRKR